MDRRLLKMSELFLTIPTIKHKQHYEEMMNEWELYGGRLNPGALQRNGVAYEKWLVWIEDDRYENTCPQGSVP